MTTTVELPPATLRLQTTTLILVRHADAYASARELDPSLTAPAGAARAAELVRVAGQANIEGIYASQFRRTQETVEPLRQHLRLPVTQIDKDRVDDLTTHVFGHHGGRVVLIADSIPRIVERVGGGTITPIHTTEFDRLIVVDVTHRPTVRVSELQMTRVTILRYGA